MTDLKLEVMITHRPLAEVLAVAVALATSTPPRTPVRAAAEGQTIPARR